MIKILNDRFLRALQRQSVDRTPVWIMRQAGRYMPEYKALRSRVGDFLTLCKTPEFACEATMLPLQRFDLDAAILFSDILMIPEAMGMGLSFVAEGGPKFSKVITAASDISKLPHLDPEQDLFYVSAAIRLITKTLNNSVPLIGFAGSPWTVATYMVEGQTSKQFYKIKGLMYKEPQLLHKLLAHMTIQTTNALQAQINAGVNAVMVFDTWGGILTDQLYKEFSLRYMAEIVSNLKSDNPSIPVILFSKNSGRCLVEQAATGCDALGLDWTVNLSKARALVGDKVALQGNLDPCVLYGSKERIVIETKAVLEQYGSGPGHIFNLGHGIPLDVDPNNVQIILDTIKNHGINK
jgi:uroporphyrinogen decarboxylase